MISSNKNKSYFILLKLSLIISIIVAFIPVSAFAEDTDDASAIEASASTSCDLASSSELIVSDGSAPTNSSADSTQGDSDSANSGYGTSFTSGEYDNEDVYNEFSSTPDSALITTTSEPGDIDIESSDTDTDSSDISQNTGNNATTPADETVTADYCEAVPPQDTSDNMETSTSDGVGEPGSGNDNQAAGEDLDNTCSPEQEPSAPPAVENTTDSPRYFQVEQVSMSPLLQPGNIIELVSADYTDGDLVVAQMADDSYVVKMLDGDELVSLNAGTSYSAADLTILGAAATSSLTAADLEASGLPWSIALATTAVMPGGSGTPEAPYQIANLGNLYWIAENSDRWSSSYIQTADIDASSTNSGEGWRPIGCWYNTSSENSPFTGSYNGDNYSISSLYINRPDTKYVGLFGYVGEGGMISNVALNGVVVTGNNYVGGLVGRNEGEITGSCATGSVTGNLHVGGLVGINYGEITNSYAGGMVSGTGINVGGLAGTNLLGTITKSYATNTVIGTDNSVGGLVGLTSSGTITDSYATGAVTGNNQVGGLVGQNTISEITNSYASGYITGNDRVDGLVGYNHFGTIDSKSGLKEVSEIQTLAFHQDTLGWDITGDDGFYPQLGWQVNWTDNIWYMGTPPAPSNEDGSNQEPTSDIIGYGGDYGFAIHFVLPPATGTALTNISRQAANTLISPAFVTGGSTANLARALAAYNQAKLSYEANYGTMNATQRAVAETELTIARAAILALDALLAAQGGVPYDLIALIAAFESAEAVLTRNANMLSDWQIATAQSILQTITVVVASLTA